jgi:hypothetical protein
VDSFSYTNTPCGLKNAWTGWLASEPYWCNEAHEHKPPHQIGSKPCLNWLTRGAIPCPFCRPNRPKKCLGWVLVYREMDGAPCMVIVHDTVADLMVGLGFGSHVLIGRMEDQVSTFVKPTTTAVPFKTNLDYRKCEIDHAVSLLTVWAIPALSAWVAAGAPQAPAAEPIAPGRFRLSVPPPTSRVESLAIDAERTAPAGESGTGEALARAMRRVKSAAQNGRHKPPEGSGNGGSGQTGRDD